jgi:hypothetical protein
VEINTFNICRNQTNLNVLSEEKKRASLAGKTVAEVSTPFWDATEGGCSVPEPHGQFMTCKKVREKEIGCTTCIRNLP